MAEKKLIEEVVYKNQEERLAALKSAMREFNKSNGKTVLQFGNTVESIEKQSTGIKEVDELLGGGFPRGIFSVAWGDKACGKSTLAMSLAAKAQQEGKIVYWIALESFDKDRAKLIGIDVDAPSFILGQFAVAEESLDSIIQFCQKKLVDVIVLDSIHSLSPKQEMQEKNGDGKSTENDSMALLARKLSQFFRMAVDAVKRANACVLLIGQTRTSLGFIAMETLSGGHALAHNSRITVHMRRGQKADAPMEKIKLEDGKTETKQIGFDCVLKLDKVQITGCKPELTDIHIPFYFASGFNKEVPQLLKAEEVLKEELKDPEFKKEYDKKEVVLEKGVVPTEEIKKRGRPSKKEK